MLESLPDHATPMTTAGNCASGRARNCGGSFKPGTATARPSGSMKSVIFINSQSSRKVAILSGNADYAVNPKEQMELVILLLIGFAIAIFILLFVALAKANNTKRVVDDLVKRLSSLENEICSLRGQTVPPVKPETSAPAAEVVVPPPLPIIGPPPAIPETGPEPP